MPARYAAKSATIASSSGKPVGGDSQAAVGCRLDEAVGRELGDLLFRERPAGERGEAREVDAFGEPQAHQQEFVARLDAAERFVGDDAVAASLRPASASASGRFSVAVAWRRPSMSRRPWAPGPMPAYSW